MRKNILFFLLFCFCVQAKTELSFTPEDRIQVERILNTFKDSLALTTGEMMVQVAQCFLNVPYVGGTLEVEEEERLVVNVDSVDCTTFVEYVVAATLTLRSGALDFGSFCDNLQKVRYRNGVINGYTSRLHYISDWINDNARKGLVQEVVDGETFTGVQMLNLNFMSKHTSSYKHLADNLERVEQIKQTESAYQNYSVYYIPKSLLSKSPQQLPVQNGDVLALVTSIEGLDVAHLGIAVWVNDVLHLLNASSIQEKVVLDEQPLYDYMANKKSQLGVRVVRVK